MKVLITVITHPATREFAISVGRTAATAVAEHLISEARSRLDDTGRGRRR